MACSAILRVSIALLMAFAALASTGRAQNAPPAQVRPPLDGWYGEVTWSFHHKEDTTRSTDENRSETKSDGKATIRVRDIGGGRFTGLLEGSQKVDTFWIGWRGGPYAGQVCRGSAPPTRVWARVEGSPTPGGNAPSLQLVDVHAEVRPTWSGGGPNLTCSEMQPFDIIGGTLSALLRSVQSAGDGTYRAGFDTNDAAVEAHSLLILRPGYCGYGIDRGAFFASSATGGGPKVYASPLATSTSVGRFPNGSRLFYDRVMQVGGQTWFHVSQGGRPAGWVSSADVICRRPYGPAPMQPTFPGYSLEWARPVSQTGGGRG